MDLLPEVLVDLLFRWELILIGLGIYLMATERKGRTGLLLFLVGLLFWIPDAFDLPDNYSVWPLLLLLIGLYFLLSSDRSSKKKKVRHQKEARDRFQETVIFGSNERIVNSEHFQGGDVMAIFGESHIDLTRCHWAEGSGEIEVFFLFGGGTIHVPPEWDLEIDVVQIFGSFSDKRTQKLERGSQETPRPRVTGFCIFGEGKIRD